MTGEDASEPAEVGAVVRGCCVAAPGFDLLSLGLEFGLEQLRCGWVREGTI